MSPKAELPQQESQPRGMHNCRQVRVEANLLVCGKAAKIHLMKGRGTYRWERFANGTATAKALVGTLTFFKAERSKNKAQLQQKPNFVSARTQGMAMHASSMDVRDGAEPKACIPIPPLLQFI